MHFKMETLKRGETGQACKIQIKMTVRPKLCASSVSATLHSIGKSQRSLQVSEPRIRIWKQDQEEDVAGGGVRTLKLSHPLLRLLERFNGSLKLFDQIHAQLLLAGLFQHPLAAGRAVKNLCLTSLSLLPRAVTLFAHLNAPDAFIANTILRSFLSSGEPEAALRFYQRLAVTKGVEPNHYTFPLLAKICAELDLSREGEKTHGLSMKFGLSSDLFVQNSMIHMYFALRMVGPARKLFDERYEEDLVTWNSMIDGYAKNGMVDSARGVFDEMPERDLVSWNSMISGYMEMGDIDNAEELFVAMPARDTVSWNSMIEGYVQAEKVEVAREIFDRMPVRNVISWNTMLSLYTRTKKYDECLKLFDKMMDSGEVKPNEATFVSLLTACAHEGELGKGKWINSYIKNDEIVESDVLLLTALMTMYAKCGDMDMAGEVFDGMPEKNVVSWNSMIMGYAMHGQAEKSIRMFLEMEKKGPRPNDVTFICLLSACVHGGMVLEAWWYFDRMRRIYKIEPKIEHYGCMVDLLGRAGLLKDSKVLLETMPMEPPPALLGALSTACRNHDSFDLGKAVCKKLIELEPRDVGPYVLLSNIYAAEGRWEDVEKVREMMKEKELQKTAGLSLVDLSEPEPEKLAASSSDHKRIMIYSMLSEMGSLLKSSCKLPVDSQNLQPLLGV